jgi:hypothetical protein
VGIGGARLQLLPRERVLAGHERLLEEVTRVRLEIRAQHVVEALAQIEAPRQ